MQRSQGSGTKEQGRRANDDLFNSSIFNIHTILHSLAPYVKNLAKL